MAPADSTKGISDFGGVKKRWPLHGNKENIAVKFK